MKYSCYDWNGNKKAENIDNLKDAVREALRLDCEVHDENGDTSIQNGMVGMEIIQKLKRDGFLLLIWKW